MANLKELLRDYVEIIAKVVLEGIAFLVSALILGKGLHIVFYPGTDLLPFAPSAVAVVTFSVAFSKNYCFLEEDKYGLFPEKTESTKKTISDYTDS